MPHDKRKNSAGLTEEKYVFAELSISFGKLFDHPFRQWVLSLHDIAGDWSFDACISFQPFRQRKT